MKILKVTYGWVVQVYDTEEKKYIAATFLEDDGAEVLFENEQGDVIEVDEEPEYLPIELVQPSKW